MAVYPRVCGGTRRRGSPRRLRRGLSPRVRGNPLAYLLSVMMSGSIPACAGEPRQLHLFSVIITVYPRVCGGTYTAHSLATAKEGLSPRVRGNLGNQDAAPSNPGSIPACAGEPRCGRPLGCCLGVYPRVCGGTSGSKSTSCRASGLSPRVRGNRYRHRLSSCWPGSIPACAGEPSLGYRRGRGVAVYPRVCGGTGVTVLPNPGVDGLSPRVRGNPRATR